jgi:hypothetical protein
MDEVAPLPRAPRALVVLLPDQEHPNMSRSPTTSCRSAASMASVANVEAFRSLTGRHLPHSLL